MLNPSLKGHLHTAIEQTEACFYFYDLDSLKAHLDHVMASIDENIQLWYACKANPLSAILKTISKAGIKVDVASLGELSQVLNSQFKAADILATGPAKSKQYLRSLLKQDVNVIVLESLSQAYWLNEVAKELNKQPNVLLRVQIEWDGGASVLGGDDVTPFGLSAEQWQQLEFEKISQLNIIGCHLFQWGNILDLDRLEQIWDKTSIELKQLAENLAISLKVIDFGGGLGIPYSESDTALDFKEVTQVLNNLREKHQLDQIWMELGRYLVGPFGYYCSKVIDRKIVRGLELLILEGGINHMARPTLTAQAFPCHLLRETDSSLQSFQVHGPLCTALDELGTFDLPADIVAGDWLVFSGSGAYGFTESMPFFLCHDLPAEVILEEENITVLRKNTDSKSWMV